jgi:hypothetical protein
MNAAISCCANVKTHKEKMIVTNMRSQRRVVIAPSWKLNSTLSVPWFGQLGWLGLTDSVAHVTQLVFCRIFFSSVDMHLRSEGLRKFVTLYLVFLKINASTKKQKNICVSCRTSWHEFLFSVKRNWLNFLSCNRSGLNHAAHVSLLEKENLYSQRDISVLSCSCLLLCLLIRITTGKEEIAWE